MKETYFSAVLSQAVELARRAELIRAADYTCEKCGVVAWSRKIMRTMQLRPKESVAGKPSTGDWVVCQGCAAKWDAKHQKRAG